MSGFFNTICLISFCLSVIILFALAGCNLTVGKLQLSATDTAGDSGEDERDPTTSMVWPDAGTSGSNSFFVYADTRTNLDILEANIRSMYAVDPGARACFNVGDITAVGKVSEWDAHHLALSTGAPDDSVPFDVGGIVRQSRFRTDVSEWGDYIRYFGVLGNHDVSDGDWYENWNAYLPGQSGLGHNSKSDGIYFAQVLGSALFVVLDSEHMSDEQNQWLRDILAGADSHGIVWKLVFFHRPVYPCNLKFPFHAGLAWVEIFEEYGVDIAFCGHSHTYERTCPMVGGVCAAGGVTYVNTSGGAATTRAVIADKQGTVTLGDRTDEYDCAQILSGYKGYWHHFCHFSYDDCALSMSCYAHDSAFAVKKPIPFDTTHWGQLTRSSRSPIASK